MFATMPATGKVKLKTNFADYPVSKALKSGEIKSDLVEFDFCGTKTANQSFKAMVREGKFDAGELAIVTFLQAKAWGKPITLLPATVVGRFQHQFISYNARLGDLEPKDIEGKRVGVRAWSQTTGVWVRGILQHQCGVDLKKIRWSTYEDPHVAEYGDPAFLARFEPNGRTMEQLMLDDDLFDAIINPPQPNEPRQRTLFRDPKAAALEWHRQTGAMSINHLFVVSDEVAKRPEVVREIWRMLVESKTHVPAPADGIDPLPFGLEANRKNLQLVIDYAWEQDMLPRKLTVDELFTDVTASLGA